MDKRHDEAIQRRLEQVLTEGCAYISWNELYLWYGQKRIAAGTYRDLSERWDALLKSVQPQSSTGWIKRPKDLGHLVFVRSPMSVSAGIHVFGSKMPSRVYEPE